MSICAKIVFSQNRRYVKNEVFDKKLHFLFLSFLCCCKRNWQKEKWKKAKTPHKNRVFMVVIQKWEKWKNGFLAKIAWHYLCQEGRKMHTICFGQFFLDYLAFFGLSLFHFLFLCLSLVLFFLTSCFSCQFLVLAFCFCFVCFLFQDVLLLVCFCVLSRLLWFTILYIFPCILFSCCCCCFGFCFDILLFFDFWLPIKKHLSKNGDPETKNKNAEKKKTDILTRTVSTDVFTNSVFLFLCFFEFCIFAESTIKRTKNAKNTSFKC